DSLKDSAKGWTENKAATDEAAKRFETTASKVAILEANVNDAAITIGQELLPVLADLSVDAVAWISAHRGDIHDFAVTLSGGIRDTVTWAKKLDWPAIGNALKAGADGAKFIVGAFLDAPPWLQQFLAVGFVANKFTGGAVQDVIGELGKGLIKGVLGMTAGVVNINAGVVNGGVGGAAGAAGGAGAAGVAGKGLSLIQKVFIVGVAAEVASQIAGPTVQLGKDIHDQVFGSNGDPLADFGKAWDDWRRTADWPFGQSGAPAWAGGTDSQPGGMLPKTGGLSPEDRQDLNDHLDRLDDKLGEIAPTTAEIERATSRGFADQTAAINRQGVLANHLPQAAARQQQALEVLRGRMEADRTATVTAGATTAAAARAAGLTAAEAIRVKRMSVALTNVNNNTVTVTARNITSKTTQRSSVATGVGFGIS